MIDYKSPLSSKQMGDVATRTRAMVAKRLDIAESRVAVTVSRGTPAKGQTFAFNVKVRIDENDPTPAQSSAIGTLVLEVLIDAVRWAIAN